ncbi:hypothetical protein [Mobilicoccus caccae]|nr:hypothetical protein [Mobilicoccus caccae]
MTRGIIDLPRLLASPPASVYLRPPKAERYCPGCGARTDRPE